MPFLFSTVALPSRGCVADAQALVVGVAWLMPFDFPEFSELPQRDQRTCLSSTLFKRAWDIKKQTSLVLAIVAWRVYHQLWLYRRMCHAPCGAPSAVRSPCSARANLFVTCGRSAVALLGGDTQHLFWGQLMDNITHHFVDCCRVSATP